MRHSQLWRPSSPISSANGRASGIDWTWRKIMRQGSHNFHPDPPSMTAPSVTPSQVRCALLLRDEIALLDVRHEAAFATGHPLFAANMAADRIVLEAETRLPRKDVPIVVYDAGEGLVPQAVDRLEIGRAS